MDHINHLKIQLQPLYGPEYYTNIPLPPSPKLTPISNSILFIEVYKQGKLIDFTEQNESVNYNKLSHVVDNFLEHMFDDSSILYSSHFNKLNSRGIVKSMNPYTDNPVEISQNILMLLVNHEFTLPVDNTKFEIRFTLA